MHLCICPPGSTIHGSITLLERRETTALARRHSRSLAQYLDHMHRVIPAAPMPNSSGDVRLAKCEDGMGWKKLGSDFPQCLVSKVASEDLRTGKTTKSPIEICFPRPERLTNLSFSVVSSFGGARRPRNPIFHPSLSWIKRQLQGLPATPNCRSDVCVTKESIEKCNQIWIRPKNRMCREGS